MDALPSLEVKHAHARLELRERQLQELAGTMNELSTEEVSYCSLKLLQNRVATGQGKLNY